MEKVRWGIIGCGNVTEVKSGPAFSKISDSKLVAVMRRDGVLAKDYAQRHNVSKWYDNAEDLINDPNVNAVYVATPPSSHAELTIKALNAGKPVYVEKPMALNFFQCQAMIKASEKTGIPLYVAYYRRALSGFLKVKALIDSGQIGRVKTINMQLYKSQNEEELSAEKPWRVDPGIAGGGHFVDLASHQLDFLDFLFGPIIKVNAITLNQLGAYTAEDMVSANFQFENNIVATGSWSFSVPEFLNRDIIEIIGEKGSIGFSCFGYTPIEVKTIAETEIIDFPVPDHVQQELISLVVDDILGKGKSPSTGTSGARTSWVMDEVLKEYYS